MEPPLDKPRDKGSSIAPNVYSLANVTIYLEKEFNFFIPKIISGEKGLSVLVSWWLPLFLSSLSFLWLLDSKQSACRLGPVAWSPRTAPAETLWLLSRGTQCSHLSTPRLKAAPCARQGEAPPVCQGSSGLGSGDTAEQGCTAGSNQNPSVRGRNDPGCPHGTSTPLQV